MNTIETDLALQLHEKATRGDALTPEEQAHLDRWYARLDLEENATLARASASQAVTSLRVQVNAALVQLQTATQHIQSLTAENEAARQEIAALQKRLAQRSTKQPA